MFIKGLKRISIYFDYIYNYKYRNAEVKNLSILLCPLQFFACSVVKQK